METNSSMTHFPPSPPLALHYSPSKAKEEAPPLALHYSPSIVKEEAPPLGVHPPLLTNLLSPPTVKPEEPYYGNESCQVEEEIPPSWQLAGTNKETIVVSDDERGKGEEASHIANHLVEEHFELLFEMWKRQDDQMHCQGIISQRMGILFKALMDAPAKARCPTCRKQFTPICNDPPRYDDKPLITSAIFFF
jgi:hypothetical protein